MNHPLKRSHPRLLPLLYVLLGTGGVSPGTGFSQTDVLVPNHGALYGGNLVFADLKSDVPPPEAKVSAQFGSDSPVAGVWDDKSHCWAFPAPAHAKLETVPVALTVNGERSERSLTYTYTTYGKQDVPLLTINQSVLQKNAAAVRQMVPPGVQLGVVLKNGDPAGYLGKILEEAVAADYFCVPKLQDGVDLREAGVRAPIVILYLESPENIPVMLHYDLEPAALSVNWVERANNVLERCQGVLNVHLWVDTGMGREGVIPSQALELGRAIAKSPRLKLKGIATHFSCIDSKDLAELNKNNAKNETVRQKARLDGVLKQLRAENIGLDAVVHAGTSDVLRYKLQPLYYNMLRVGSLFFENPTGRESNYAWTTRLQQVKTLPKGWSVDYGAEKRVKKETLVGLIGHIPDRNGKRVFYVRDKAVKPLLDDAEDGMIVLDLSGFKDVKEGELVRIEFDPSSDSPLDSSLPVPVTFSQK